VPFDSYLTLGRSGLAVSPFAADTFGRGGTTVNGQANAAWPMAPKSDTERY
jgi:hypothetical protein